MIAMGGRSGLTAHQIVVSNLLPNGGLKFLRGFGIENQRSFLHLEAVEEALHIGVVSQPLEDVGEPHPHSQKPTGPPKTREPRVLALGAIMPSNKSWQLVSVGCRCGARIAPTVTDEFSGCSMSQ